MTEITTRTQRIFLRPDGILQTVNISTAKQTLDHARENVLACAQVAQGMRRPVYVDTTTPAPLTTDGQKYYASEEVAKVVTAVAIAVKNPLGRIIGNFVIAMQSSAAPMRLFDGEATAIAWLKGFL